MGGNRAAGPDADARASDRAPATTRLAPSGKQERRLSRLPFCTRYITLIFFNSGLSNLCQPGPRLASAQSARRTIEENSP